jgi:hypothetical protein
VIACDDEARPDRARQLAKAVIVMLNNRSIMNAARKPAEAAR